jgi:hypothetical protein
LKNSQIFPGNSERLIESAIPATIKAYTSLMDAMCRRNVYD